jgi:hypothetical protein
MERWNSLPPCGGGLGRGVAPTSPNPRKGPYSVRLARPPSPALPHKGGGGSARRCLRRLEPDSRGLVPGIPRRMRSIRPHAQRPSRTSRVARGSAAWMAGTSPAMTSNGGAKPNCISDSTTFRCPRQTHSQRRRTLAHSANACRLPSAACLPVLAAVCYPAAARQDC